jgi:hypothetical protein
MQFCIYNLARLKVWPIEKIYYISCLICSKSSHVYALFFEQNTVFLSRLFKKFWLKTLGIMPPQNEKIKYVQVYVFNYSFYSDTIKIKLALASDWSKWYLLNLSSISNFFVYDFYGVINWKINSLWNYLLW